MKKLLLPALAAFALLSSGCLNRRLVRIQDHPTQPVLLMQTIDTTVFLLPIHVEHVFWQCAEGGNQLTCQRACGGATEFECPQTAMNMGSTSPAILQGWIDWDGNGSFQANEELKTGNFAPNGATVPANVGLNNAQLCFTVPANATFASGNVMARFRLSPDGGLDPVGGLDNGGTPIG